MTEKYVDECAAERKPEIIVIVVTPVANRPGRFTARLGDQVLIESSHQPLLDGARRLIELGHDPDAILAMRHAGSSDTDALRSTVGSAAMLAVSEGERDRPRFRCWKASPFREGSPSIAPSQRLDHPEPEAPKPTGKVVLS